MKNPIPYPLRAAKISISFHPFGFWVKPMYYYANGLTERAKADGETLWWVRFAWLQISFSRWV